jgi:hypothetical protein
MSFLPCQFQLFQPIGGDFASSGLFCELDGNEKNRNKISKTENTEIPFFVVVSFFNLNMF